MEQARREHIQAAPIFCMRLTPVALRDHHKRVQTGLTCAISYLPRPRPASRGRQALTGSSTCGQALPGSRPSSRLLQPERPETL